MTAQIDIIGDEMGVDRHIIDAAPVGDHHRQIVAANIPDSIRLTSVGGEG